MLGIKINTEQTWANAKSGKPAHTVYDSKAWDSHSCVHQMGRSLFSTAREKQGKLLNGSSL